MENTDALGQDIFLSLLTTQLQYQDPLEPMDSTAFVTQLAQFSQLEQATQMTDQLTQLLDVNTSLNNYGATALIGKEVQIEGGGISIEEGSSADFSYRLEAEAQDIAIYISDDTGQIIRTLSPGAQLTGLQSLNWDGRDKDGNVLASGNYSFEVFAKDLEGEPVESQTLSRGIVTGVSYENNAPYVNVNGSKIPAADVISVSG